MSEVVVRGTLSPLFALNVALPALNNLRTSISPPILHEPEFNFLTEVGKTFVNGVPKTFRQIGDAVVNSGKFADGMAHILTGGLSELEPVNNEGEEIMQVGGEIMGAVYTVGSPMTPSLTPSVSPSPTVTLQPTIVGAPIQVSAPLVHAKAKAPRNYKGPIGRRYRFSSRKEAYQAAKLDSKNKSEPIFHNDKRHGPHYHASDGKGKPLNHNHYYFNF